MYCRKCGYRMEDTDRFCPDCGAVNEFCRGGGQGGTDTVTPTAPNAGYGAMPAPAPGGGYPDRRSKRNDAIRRREPKRKRPKKIYQPVPAGRRTLCVVLCLLTALFSFVSLVIISARITAGENNIRVAYREGSLSDVTVVTDSGSVSLPEWMMQNVVNVRTNQPIGLDRARAEKFLRKTNVNTFVEDILVDYAGCFILGKEPTHLNADRIADFLSLVSFDARYEIGYYIPEQVIEDIRQRINGGDLSYLSIDRDGGAFKTRYGVDPGMVSTVFSGWMMAVSIALALICAVLVFVLCAKNFPLGLRYIGLTLMIYGAVNLLISSAVLIIAAVSSVFFLSAALCTLAMAVGVFSLIPLIIGILMMLLRGRLKKNSAADEPAEAEAE